jgi:scyllo-inositol 2-dehydrogenase (NADP+)
VAVRVGMIGTGWVAQARHIPSFAGHSDVQIVGIYDRHLEHAQRVADKLPSARPVADLDELFALGPDLISIATPPWSHAELAVTAFEHGAHVFTEKPMAMNTAEARAMVAASERANRMLCVSHNFVFSRAVARGQRFLADSAVHYVAGVQLSSLERRLPSWYQELPGGLLFDEVPHLLYLLDHFIGPMVVEHVRFRGSAGSEPRAAEVLLGGTAPGQITMVFGAPVSEWQVVVTGDRGVVALDLFRDIAVRVRPDGAHRAGDILKTSVKAVVGHTAGFVASGTRLALHRTFWGHDVLIHRFVDATLGRGPMPVTTDQALRVVGIAERLVDELSEVAARR